MKTICYQKLKNKNENTELFIMHFLPANKIIIVVLTSGQLAV
jgi:hypothetical protein